MSHPMSMNVSDGFFNTGVWPFFVKSSLLFCVPYCRSWRRWTVEYWQGVVVVSHQNKCRDSKRNCGCPVLQ